MSSSSMHNAMRTMHALLRGEASPEQAAAQLHTSVAGLRVYQSLVRRAVLSALEKNYTIAKALWPAERWHRISSLYFEQHVSTDVELNGAVESFPGFLATLAAEPSWASEVTAVDAEIAALEWEEWAAYRCADEIPAPGDPARPQLNPTLRVLQFTYGISAFVRAARRYREGDATLLPAVPSTPDPEVVFVYRHPTTELHAFCRADQALLLGFKAAHDGLSASDTAHAAALSVTVITSIFERCRGLGIVV